MHQELGCFLFGLFPGVVLLFFGLGIGFEVRKRKDAP